MPDNPTLTPKSVRIAQDEARWLTTAADRAGVSQNDLIRLALQRLRKELGAANRIKPDAVLATAKASKYKLAAPRTPASKTSAKPAPTASSHSNAPGPEKTSRRARKPAGGS